MAQRDDDAPTTTTDYDLADYARRLRLRQRPAVCCLPFGRPNRNKPSHGTAVVSQLANKVAAANNVWCACLAPKVAVCPSGDFLGSQRIQENRQHGSQKNTGSNSNKQQQITKHRGKKSTKKKLKIIYISSSLFGDSFLFFHKLWPREQLFKWCDDVVIQVQELRQTHSVGLSAVQDITVYVVCWCCLLAMTIAALGQQLKKSSRNVMKWQRIWCQRPVNTHAHKHTHTRWWNMQTISQIQSQCWLTGNKKAITTANRRHQVKSTLEVNAAKNNSRSNWSSTPVKCLLNVDRKLTEILLTDFDSYQSATMSCWCLRTTNYQQQPGK